MQVDIGQIIHFLNLLHSHGRHTIASEAPFGNDGGPKWEGGATYEAHQRNDMIADIKERQMRGSNVYYSVNCPCPISERVGLYGKNNIDDIIAIRALVFDIDFTCAKTEQLIDALLGFIDKNLDGELRPSMVISTGGGYQLIYLLDEHVIVKLFRPAKFDVQKKANEIYIERRMAITTLAHEFEAHLRKIIPSDLPIKIDNMSNVDRVMRLPGTVNYPKAEKIAKGQKPALACITKDYGCKCNIKNLRSKIPQIQVSRSKQVRVNVPFIPRKDPKWPPERKAEVCCEFIAKEGLADTNEWYTLNVMLPLIGAIHDPDDNNRITETKAEECFMLAVSGGVRYGTIGRGPRYFMRQWKSHRPHLVRNGTKSLGGLIWAAESNGFVLPWKDKVMWEADYIRMKKEADEQRNSIPEDLVALLKNYV